MNIPCVTPTSVEANERRGSSRASGKERDDGTGGDVAKFRVLIVDDDEGFRESFHWVLEQVHQCDVEEAEHAQKLDHWMRSGVSFDLIFVDVQMPEKDGIQIYQDLRAAGDVTPVVLMSALAQNRARVERLGVLFFDKALDGPALGRIIARHGGGRVQ